MAQIAELREALLNLDNLLSSCMRCGNCQAVCPVFGESVRESDVARGKIVLLQNLAYNIIQDADAIDERLNRCLLCGACQANCASGVKTLEIFVEARRILTEFRKLAPIKKFIFRYYLTQPKLFAKSLQFGSLFQSVVVRKQDNAQGTSRAPLLDKFLGKRHIPSLPKQQLLQKYGNLREKGKKHNIIFYTGCMIDKIYPQIGEAVIKILKHHDIGINMSSEFACCGMPTLCSGDQESFKILLKKNIEIFKKLDVKEMDYIVFACPSCNESVHVWWDYYVKDPNYFTHEERETLEAISKKTIDIHKFLYSVLDYKENEKTSTKNTKKITYHDSCHLKKSLHVDKEPRALLKQVNSYDFVEMPDSDKCCGCGGSFTLTQPELSLEIGTRKRENIIASNADMVTTGCPACMMQLSDILARFEDRVPVKHSIEIIAENLS